MNMIASSASEISKGFSFINLVARNNIKQLLQSLNSKTTVGISSIQPKLVRLVDIPFFNLMNEAINFHIQHSIFPGSAKIVSINPLDKRKQKKRDFKF